MRRLAFALLLPFVAGCAAMSNTLAQDLAWERWEKCSHFRGITLKEIRTDGQIWVWIADGGEQTAWRQCDAAAMAEQGARRAGAPAAATQVVAQGGAAARGPIPLPDWKVGHEWAYRYENPASTGTFVWTVDRRETLDGLPHWVIKTGTREIFYRVDSLALTKETVEGRVVRQVTPAEWRFMAFPLAVGTSWDMKWHEERPLARETESVERGCRAEAEETVTVPAGTFSTIRVSCRNLRDNAWLTTLWYSAQVRHIVKEEAAVTGGKRVRELIAYRLR
jgi:hypothetical protein